jgi:hypothetical protein
MRISPRRPARPVGSSGAEGGEAKAQRRPPHGHQCRRGGLLTAALVNPLWLSTVHTSADLAVLAAALILLVVLRALPIVVVLLAAGAGLALGG